MKRIPDDKLQHYDKLTLSLIESGNQLDTALKRRSENIYLDSFIQMVLDLVEVAFTEIARRGIKVLITFDQKTYERDLEKMANGDKKIYLLFDDDFLFDINPLLKFVSNEKKKMYEAMKIRFLNDN